MYSSLYLKNIANLQYEHWGTWIIGLFPISKNVQETSFYSKQ